VNETVLIDTGYWIALFDPRQGRHAEAEGKEDYLDLLTLLVPWPTVYETLRTRFARRSKWVAEFHELLKQSNVRVLDDGEYRERALDQVREFSVEMERPISMVDMVCRLMIEDPDVRVDYMLTTNPRDFVDVCERNGVEML
jgi:predicted nucleic acid-binding protein